MMREIIFFAKEPTRLLASFGSLSFLRWQIGSERLRDGNLTLEGSCSAVVL